MMDDKTIPLEQDIRIVKRNVAKGFVSQADSKAALSGLPDLTEQSEWFDPEAPEEEEAPFEMSPPELDVAVEAAPED